MKDILTASWMVEMIRTTTNMYNHGWDERNGGNVSLLLSEAEVADYVDTDKVLREIPTGFACPELDGKYFLVTGTGFLSLQSSATMRMCSGVVPQQPPTIRAPISTISSSVFAKCAASIA